MNRYRLTILSPASIIHVRARAGPLLAASAAGACLLLALERGGMAAAAQATAYGWVLLCLAVWSVAAWRAREAMAAPLSLLLVVAWPLAQLAPWPSAVLARFDPQRAAELAQFAALGIAPAPTASLYPYATFRAVVMLAGTIALYVLVRDVCRKQPATLEWLAAGVLLLAMAEAAPALRQYLLIESGASRETGPGTEFIRGTFGNRNLLAAWLEGCYGVALGVLMSSPGRARWLRWLAAVAAVVAAMVVVCSLSRMGLVGIAAETLFFAAVAWCGGRRRVIVPAALVAVALACAGAVGLRVIAGRYSSAAFETEKHGRLAMWADAARAVRRYPVVGAGAGAFAFAFRRSQPYFMEYTIDHPHNDYLETAVEWGIPAALLLAAGAWWSVLSGVAGLLRRPGAYGVIGLGCFAGAGALLLHSAVDFPLRVPTILALFAVLMGMGSAAQHVERGRAQWRAAGILAMSLAAGLLLVARPAAIARWDAEARYREARREFELGHMAAAEAGYRRALAADPYAAVVWSDLASIAEARGDAGAALAASGMAETLEPHTRRVGWRAANLRLRMNDTPRALDLLAEIAAETPEMRRPAWEVCWSAGVAPELILGRLVGTSRREREAYAGYLAQSRIVRMRSAMRAASSSDMCE